MATATVRILRTSSGRPIQFAYVDRMPRERKPLAVNRVRCGGGFRVLGKKRGGDNY